MVVILYKQSTWVAPVSLSIGVSLGTEGIVMAAGLAELEAELEQIRRSIKSNVQLLHEARGHLKVLEELWQSRADDVRSSTSLNAHRLNLARVQLEISRKLWKSHADMSLEQVRKDTARNLAEERAAIESQAAETLSKSTKTVTRLVNWYAPGYLSCAWADETWRGLTNPTPGEWVRVGYLGEQSGAVPISLPISAGVWRIEQPDGWNYGRPNPEQFRALIRNTILRLIVSFDVPLIRTVAFDPHLTLDLGGFAAIRSVQQQSVPPPVTSVEDLERELASLVHDLATVRDRLTAAGFNSYWSALAAQHPLAKTTPLRLLVVATPPKLMSDRGFARLAQIRKLATNSGLLIIESSARGEAGSIPTHGLSISLRNSSSTSTAIPGVSWTADEALPDQILRSICTALVDRTRPSLAPVVAFRSIVESIKDSWLADADEGLEVPIGVTESGRLIVRFRSEDPAKAHALVGGTNGSGKTNLLLVLIHALAARYSPADLELVVVDLKDEESVEFARFAPSRADGAWLPHLRALGLQFDRDYSVAMLQWVTERMTERAKQLSESSSIKLKEYRAQTGKPMPRLVIVIDEFHRLFEGSDDQIAQAASLLEHIARTGRSRGVHLILSSQSMTGIRGLAAKQSAIFSQFHNRISLQNTDAESREFLSPHNNAAAELEDRGQVVVNDARGVANANRFGTVALADESYLAELRAKWFAQRHGGPPSVFRSSEFATWMPAFAHETPVTGIAPVVGLPIGIEPSPRRVELGESPNQGLAVVGTDRDVALSVLVRAVVTTAASLGESATVTLLDGHSPSDAVKPWIAALVTQLEQNGAMVERVERVAIASRLNELAASSSLPRLLVPIALDSVDLATPVGPGPAIPSNSLRTLLQNGPHSRCWTIGWWQSKSVLNAHLGYGAPGIRAWAFCGVSLADLTEVCGHGVRQPVARPRLVWFDKTPPSGAEPGAERLVPFGSVDILRGISFD